MFKKWFSFQALSVLLLLIYQFTLPIGTVLAAQNTSMLPPSNLALQLITPDDGKLTWSAVFGATGYKVYEIKDGQIILLGNTAALSYSLNDLPEGSHRYAVSTINSEGESGPSAPVSADIVYPKMQTPTAFNSNIRNGNDIVLSWGTSQYAQKYNIYQISQSGDRTLVTSTIATTYTIVNPEEGLYTYSISASNDLYGESPEAFPVNVEVIYPKIEQPSNLSYTIANGNDVNLKWQVADYATSYKIYQVVDGQLELKKTLTGTSFTFSNLPAGDYTYRVYSYSDRFGESLEGGQVSLPVDPIEMTAPRNVTYKIGNINDVILNWETVTFATAYNLYEWRNGEKTLKSTVKGTSITYPMLKAGNYEYEIYSYSDRFGESEEGTKVSFSIDTVKIDPPKEFTYKIQNGNDIVLNWSTSDNATNYKVYQVVNGQKILKNTVTGTSVTLTNMAAQDYQFEVYTNSTRFGESEEAAQVSFTLEPIKISAPENVSQTTNSPTSFTLNWNSVEYATSYKVYQIVDGQKLLKNNVTGTSVSYNNMQPGAYKYEVYSFSTRFGESQTGTPIEVRLTGQALPAPENVSFSLANGNDVTLKWNAVQYATGYKIYQIVDGEEVLKRTVTTLNSTFTNMPEGQFDFVIKAYSTLLGESPNGAEVEGSIAFPVMEKPQNLTTSVSNGNDITLKWNPVSYATAYKIYQIIDGEKVLQRTVTGTTTTFTNMPEGNYQYIVQSYSDRFRESLEGSTAELHVTLPIMQAPDNLTKTISNGNDIVLKWNSSAYAKEYHIYQIIDGEKVLQRKVTGTTTTFTNMPEGDYQYFVYSYSDRFSESPKGSTVEFNLTWPIMQTPVNLTKTISNGNDIVLKWNASTYAKDYRVYRIIDGEKVLQRTVTGTTTTFANMPEGDYQYIVYSYSDRFSQSPEGSTVAFNLTWPVIEAPIVNGSVFNANNITLSWKAVPWANEYQVYKVNGDNKELLYKGSALSFKVYNLSEDTHSFEVTAYSARFGESIPSERYEQKIVFPIMEAPLASLKLLSQTSARISWDFVTYANGYNVYEIIDGKPVLLVKNLNNLSYDLQNLTYANHEYYVTSYSNSFGESKPSETVVAKLIIDTQPPETKINAPTHWVNKNQLVTLEATDNEVGVAHTFYSLNDGPIQEGTSIFVDQEGINKIRFNSIDKVGNMEEVKTEFVKIDKTAPITSTDSPETWVNYDVVVTLAAEDDRSGVAETYYSINGSEYAEGTSFVVDKEGINEISYYSVDSAGNKEEVNTQKVKIDKTAPTVYTALGKEYELGANVTLNYDADDDLSGIVAEEVILNGKVYKKGDSITLNQLGENKLTIKVTDAAGLSTTVEKTFSVYIPINLEVLPKVIKGNSGVFTVKVTLPKEYQSCLFDVSSVKLNGVFAVVDNNGLQKQAEKGHFKFNREEFSWITGEIELEFRGYINNKILVVGKTTVETKK